MDKNSKILITGGTGLVGKNLYEYLKTSGYKNLTAIGSSECDLTNTSQTNAFFSTLKPDYVFHLAGYVHGIMGNMLNKGKAFYVNSLINLNVIEACRKNNVKKITAMGTGAVYPVSTDVLKEEDLWNGPPHSSENAYAHAKRAMLAHLQAYKESYGLNYAFVISANLYGPYDNFDTEHGHVIPSLIKKFYTAHINKEPFVEAWGNGTAERDFLHAKDFTAALEKIMISGDGPINMASGFVNSIMDVTQILQELTGIKVRWDHTKPNGQARRCYNLEKIENLGYKSQYDLEKGLASTYQWFSKNFMCARI